MFLLLLLIIFTVSFLLIFVILITSVYCSVLSNFSCSFPHCIVALLAAFFLLVLLHLRIAMQQFFSYSPTSLYTRRYGTRGIVRA